MMQESTLIEGTISYQLKDFPELASHRKRRVLVGIRPFRKEEIRL